MSSDKNPTFKLILLCLQSLMPSRYQLDFAYLFVKILNLSRLYRSLLQDVDWVKKIVEKLLSAFFRGGRYWLFYLPLQQDHLEEEITMVVEKSQLPQEFLVELGKKAQGYNYFNVAATILEKSQGIVSAMRIHISNFRNQNNKHIFQWTLKKFEELDRQE